MRSMTKFVATVALALVTVAALAGQQPPVGAQGAPGAPGGGGRGGGIPARLDYATAEKMIVAAEAAAVAANARVAIAVVDANGDLVAFKRMDGAAGMAVTSSQGKARAAIVFGVPTKAVADAGTAGASLSVSITPSGVNGQALQIQQGGIPVMKDGKLVGGIGVGGSAPAQDEVFAQAGAAIIK